MGKAKSKKRKTQREATAGVESNSTSGGNPHVVDQSPQWPEGYCRINGNYYRSEDDYKKSVAEALDECMRDGK